MTNQECLRQIRKLIGNSKKGAIHVLLDESKYLIESGGIDITEDQPDSFYSAKIILHVALLEVAEQVRPICQVGNDAIENLKNF